MAQLESLPKTGWAAAKAKYNPHAYEDSVTTNESVTGPVITDESVTGPVNRNEMDPHVHDSRAAGLKRVSQGTSAPSSKNPKRT